jgi:hypothetical protein
MWHRALAVIAFVVFAVVVLVAGLRRDRDASRRTLPGR